ncbi:MAG TPA: YceI family protein [Usitatibacter sp.]|nr:YceI family protein [Usitatibacter sp.]
MRARAALFALAAVAAATALAAPVTYKIDPAHTYPSLEFPHMGISVWRGKFTSTRGTVVLDREARAGTVDVTIEAASIDFGHQVMNEAAASAEWLNADMNPTLRYVGDIRFEGDRPARVEGKLTLMGVTRPVPLKIESFKCIPHPLFRREVCGADASGAFDRADFGMKQYTSDGMGHITLRIQVEAMRE